MQKILVKGAKLQLFLDKKQSFKQFQQGFQHFAVKNRFKMLKTAPIVENLKVFVENLAILQFVKPIFAHIVQPVHIFFKFC